jgi:hypothetical protein
VHPNPFNPALVISLANARTKRPVHIAVYDARGCLVHQVKIKGGARHIWNAHGMPSGLYVVRAQAGKRTYLKKALLLK